MNILAIDIGGTAIKVLELDEKGSIFSSKEVPTEAKKGGQHLMDKVVTLIEAYSGYDCIGVSTAGQVDVVEGKIIYANENIPNYTGMEIMHILEEKFSVPVYVDNDVNAAALGEAYYGSGKENKDFLCLTYGTGIGGAIIVERSVYRGADGVAGEFGHMITHPNGYQCACDMNGCYEQYASVTALIREAQKIDSSYTSGRILFEQLEHDPRIHQLLTWWIEEVALGLVNLIHIFNPSLIVLGGGIMEQKMISEGINQVVQSKIMPAYRRVRITNAELGNKAGALGVAYRAAKKLNQGQGRK